MRLLWLVAFWAAFDCGDAANVTSAPSFPNAPQTKTIKRITSLLTTFLTTDQLNTLANIIANDIYLNVSQTQMVSDIENSAMSLLTNAQYSTAISAGAGLFLSQGMAKLEASLGTAIGVVGENCFPFVYQIQHYIATLKASGHVQKGCYVNGFRLVNSWFTKKRVGTIMTRVKNAFPASDWSQYRSAFGSFVFFSKYGL